MRSSRVLALLFLLMPLLGWANAYDQELHIAISVAKSAQPPRVIGTTLLFTHVPERPSRYVGIAFSHEHFRRIHVFERNEHGVYIAAVPLPEEAESPIVYRLVVDGVWIPDPLSRESTEDEYGNALSVLQLPPREAVALGANILPGGRVVFKFAFRERAVVHITGDFAGWDPFLYRMREEAPGTYALSLRLPPGTHDYYYVADGVRYTDPANPRTSRNSEGAAASRIVVP
jgi:hypothetical protein